MHLKVLVDTNIKRNSIIRQTTTVEQKIQWGDTLYSFEVLKGVDKAPRTDEQDRAKNIRFLASLCLAARDNKIAFYSSTELKMEEMRQRGPSTGCLGLNLINFVEVKSAKSPVKRTIVCSVLGENFGTTEEEQNAFFRSIKNERYLEICKHCQDQCDDAFHLWTAETNELDIFLTMDKKFCKNATQKRHCIASTVQVMSPKMLCEHLNLPETDLAKLKEEYPPFY